MPPTEKTENSNCSDLDTEWMRQRRRNGERAPQTVSDAMTDGHYNKRSTHMNVYICSHNAQLPKVEWCEYLKIKWLPSAFIKQASIRATVSLCLQTVSFYPHVSSSHVCVCVFMWLVCMSSCSLWACVGLCEFKWIFQRPTIPVPCVRGSFPRILAMTPSLPRGTARQPAAPAAP